MKPRKLMHLLLLLLAPCLGVTQVDIPDTPAGHTLHAWLDAFNSGDRAKVEAYVKTTDPSQSVDGLMGFRSQTGGFELLSIEDSQPLQIRFRVKEKNSETTAIGSILLKQAQPPVVDSFGLRAMPPGVAPVKITLDATLRQKTIDGVAAALNDLQEIIVRRGNHGQIAGNAADA